MGALRSFAAVAGSVLLAGGVAVSVQAAVIVPVAATGSTSYPGYADSNAIDTGGGSNVSDWASFSQGTASKLNLDLGSIYTLSTSTVTDRVTSGGGNNGFVGGLFDFTTQFSLQAFTDATFTTAIGGPLIFNHTAPIAPSVPTDFALTVGLGGLTARYLQYSVLAANGSNPGLSDIVFEGSAPGVPEPAAWALMIAGFGIVGTAMRRRARVESSFA